jgi:hypothetical protein
MRLVLASFPLGLAVVVTALVLPLRREARSRSVGQNCFACQR